VNCKHNREDMTHGEHHSSEFNAVLRDIPNIRFLDVIKDAHIRSAFASFNQTQVSNETFLVVAILITLSSVVFMFRFRAFLMSEGYDREELIAGIVLTATITTLIIILWILCYLKRKRVDPKRRKALKSLYNIQPVLQVILPIGISFFYGLQLIIRVRGGQCDSDKLYLHMLMCNPNHDTNGLPEETLAQLMLMPIVFHIILRDSLVGTFFISYLMSLASVLITAFMLNVRQVMPFLLVYFFFSTVIHYDNQRQNLSLFYLAEKLKFSLSENERLADETHASELRHMIANVAHDLKTVRAHSVLRFVILFLREVSCIPLPQSLPYRLPFLHILYLSYCIFSPYPAIDIVSVGRGVHRPGGHRLG